jgi:predicted transcriptional regulator
LLARLKIKQVEVGTRLGVTPSAVSQFVNGKRRWPDEARRKVEKLIAERSAEHNLGLA